MKHAAFLIAALLLSACQPTYTLELYDGLQREDTDVATIVPLRGCLHCVRWLQLTGKQNTIYTYPVKESPFDTPAVPGKFRVPPGRYEVQIGARRGKTAGAYWVGEVDLEPGHTYQVKTEDCGVICWGTFAGLSQTWVWMEEAADGDVLLGLRIPQNDAEGAKWNLYAAERGDDRYHYRIGLIYEEGRGVPRDYVRAYMWYSLAATNGWESIAIANDLDQMAEKPTPEQIAEALKHADSYWPFSSRLKLGSSIGLLKRRDQMAEKMTPEQIAEAQRLAREWKPK